MQGNLVLLSELQPKGHNYVIHVRISRMWEHTGTSEKNDIKHLDLVLIDEKVFIYQTCNYYNINILKVLIFFILAAKGYLNLC